jgi:hypothetical protein
VEKVANYARTRQLHIVGYYQAPERLGDTTLSPVGERVACKIKESFETPVALVVSFMSLFSPANVVVHLFPQVNGSKLNDENGGALVVRSPNDTRPLHLTLSLFLVLRPHLV